MEAIEAGTDLLEDECLRRAKEGVLKPVYQGGKKVGYVREYSDTLLIFLLKARRPEKFKDRTHIQHARTFDIEGASRSSSRYRRSRR